MTTLRQALTAYTLCARAEGRSARTIEWITRSVGYFAEFLGGDPDVSTITADDLRRFIVGLGERPKYGNHRYKRPQEGKVSPQTVNTYFRAIRAFFGHLKREEYISRNPAERVRAPKVQAKVIPTLSERELERLLSQPDRKTRRGYRDFALMLLLVDTGARVGEIAGLSTDDVDVENSYIKADGKSGQRFIPFGRKVANVLMKYKLRYRFEPVGNGSFFVTQGGRPMTVGRIDTVVRRYGQMAKLGRVHPHKLRHSSSVLYLRNGGDPFSLQRKLGHRSLQMTRYYCNLADSDVRSQHLRYGVADRLRI
jgi:integrase/recombinase XerD